ncbi:MAG TPA: LysM peptidoglycan-binding domain-containing protein [Planctomycetaceae bacterium]|nr:LysM peptidoglycan-binding domain-containing protein [Planctomycetaceae bacterium]
MARETTFGLLLVCVLTGVFGVFVYKRLHKPADLVAGTGSDPAAVAMSDQYPNGKPDEAPKTPEPSATPPSALDLLAMPTPPGKPQPVKKPTPLPTQEPDPFAKEPVIAKVIPAAKPQAASKLPVDLDADDFFSAPATAKPLPQTTSSVTSAATTVTLPDQNEPDPFAAEPVRAEPVRAVPVQTFAPPEIAASEAPFDPFAAEPVTKVETPMKSVAIPAAKPQAADADPFADDPPQAEPVTVSSRSAAVIAEPLAAEPVNEVRTFEPEPIPVAKPVPTLSKLAVEPFDNPFAAPPVTTKAAAAPVAKPTQPAPAPLRVVNQPPVTLEFPETKTASTNAREFPSDPLDTFPPVNVVVPAEKPAPLARQPLALPVDLDFGPAMTTPARTLPTTIAAPPAGGYIVEPDDNFWAISKKLYGKGQYFQALAAHNAAVVPDPAKMRPGVRIAAPPVAELEARYAALISPTQTADVQQLSGLQPIRSRPAATPGFFVHSNGQAMYRVGPGDTLGGIAFSHLGRASRSVQIFELNRDVLKDGNTLKVGAELRLPADASQVQMTGGAGGRR